MIEKTAIITSGAKYIPGLLRLITSYTNELRAATAAAQSLSDAFNRCGRSFAEMRFISMGLNVLYPSGRGITKRRLTR